jgi:hypothetical protein
MKESNNFYDRPHWPYFQDKQMTAAYAAYFKSVKWKLYATFTFGLEHSDDHADWKFNQFINLLESKIKADVIFVRGDEKRFSGCGKPACGRHFHVLLTSAAPLDPFLVECLWMSVAGHHHDGADVRPFDPELAGVKYVFKMMHQLYGEWNARNLHLVLRTKLLANAKPVKCTPWSMKCPDKASGTNAVEQT